MKFEVNFSESNLKFKINWNLEISNGNWPKKLNQKIKI